MKRPTHSETENPVVSRITDLLLEQGKTQRELEVHLGLSRGSYTEWKTGRTTSYRQRIDEIAEFFDVSPNYLLRGETKAFDQVGYTNKEVELVQLYRRLNRDSKNKLIKMATVLLNTNPQPLKLDIEE